VNAATDLCSNAPAAGLIGPAASRIQARSADPAASACLRSRRDRLPPALSAYGVRASGGWAVAAASAGEALVHRDVLNSKGERTYKPL
jgi:hypothetical protein